MPAAHAGGRARVAGYFPPAQVGRAAACRPERQATA